LSPRNFQSHDLAGPAQREPASAARAKPTDRKPGGRKPLPAHLPREQITHAFSADRAVRIMSIDKSNWSSTP
jgi:hypothetical protein